MTSETSSTGETTPLPESNTAEPSEEPTYEPPAQLENKYDCTRYSEEQREERRKQVWQMSVVERLSQRQIAEKLGVSVWTVNQDCKKVQDVRVKTLAEQDKGFIVRQDEVYEALLTRWLPVAMREHQVRDDEGNVIWSDDPSLKATDRVIKALGEQAKLHGFGAAGKVSPKEAGKEIGEAVLKAMRELAHGNKIVEAEVIQEQPKLNDRTDAQNS